MESMTERLRFLRPTLVGSYCYSAGEVGEVPIDRAAALVAGKAAVLSTDPIAPHDRLAARRQQAPEVATARRPAAAERASAPVPAAKPPAPPAAE
jgi:hypothetical protein